jgi:type IV secretion system protein VirD4
MINVINLFTRFIGWLARNWIVILVLIGPALVNPAVLIPFAREEFRVALAATNVQFVAFLAAIALSMAPGIIFKWQVAVAAALGVYHFAKTFPASPVPALEIGATTLFIGFAGIVLYMPYGAMLARLSKDVSAALNKLAPSSGDEHGSARWSTAGEAIKAFSAEQGTILGAVRKFGRETILRTKMESGHVLVVAGSRAGKTSNFAIPTALSWPTSLVVLDPKGEIAAVTANARRNLGQQVFILDHRSPATTSFMNIFDWLNPSSPRFVEDVQNCAGWLYAERRKGEGGGGSDAGKFFEATARTMLELAIARLFLNDDEEVTPRAVRKFVSRPIDDLLKAIKELVTVQHSNRLLVDYIHDLAGSLAGADVKTFANICVSTTADTKWLASPNFAAIVSGGPQNAGDLDGRVIETAQILKGATTAYICVSPDVLKTSPGFARVLIGAFLQQHYRSAGNIARDKVLYLLDEAPQLGDADVIEMTLRVGAGYNAALAYITQDLASLEQCFGKLGARAFLENAALKLMLGVSGDLETADWVSKMSGDATIQTSTSSASTSASANVGEQLIKRALLTPREVLDLPPDQAILFARAMRPIRVKKTFYKSIPEFAAVAAPNPYDAK